MNTATTMKSIQNSKSNAGNISALTCYEVAPRIFKKCEDASGEADLCILFSSFTFSNASKPRLLLS